MDFSSLFSPSVVPTSEPQTEVVLTPVQMREAIAAIMPLVRNGMNQAQIEQLALDHHKRVNG